MKEPDYSYLSRNFDILMDFFFRTILLIIFLFIVSVHGTLNPYLIYSVKIMLLLIFINTVYKKYKLMRFFIKKEEI